MENNQDIIKKAKQQLRKYKIYHSILGFCIYLIYFPILLPGEPYSPLLALAVFFLIFSIERRFVFYKFITSVLVQKLDADTYLEIIRQAKFDRPQATNQLYGEYFSSNYQNAVTICKMKMADPKINKRYTYLYLTYLANVYFDIGDMENLRMTCERFDSVLASEKPSKQEKYRKFYKQIEFYRSYLKGDIDTCSDTLNIPIRDNLSQYKSIFCKAKLALIKGNIDEARDHFETLSKKVPHLNYGKLAAVELAKMDGQDADTPSTIFDISDEITDVTLYTDKNYHFKKKVVRIIAPIALLLIIASSIILFSVERDLDAYHEQIRTLVEADYNNVKVVESFNLQNGIYVVDSMFICTSDTDIIVGCMYHYEGEEEQYYAELANLPLELLSDDSVTVWPSFAMSVTSDNYISVCFYKNKSDIPAEYHHLSTIKIDGQTVYFVVTEITPLSQTID